MPATRSNARRNHGVGYEVRQPCRIPVHPLRRFAPKALVNSQSGVKQGQTHALNKTGESIGLERAMELQMTFAELGDSKKRRTRREIFLEKMEGLIPWQQLEDRIEPYALRKRWRPGRVTDPMIIDQVERMDGKNRRKKRDPGECQQEGR